MPTLDVKSTDDRHLQDVADALAGAKKVVMITGAGISTNCGIPDFRSQDGLYSLIQSQYDSAFGGKLSAPDPTRPTTPLEDTYDTFSSSQESTLSQRSRKDSLPGNIKGKDLFDSVIWKSEESTSIFCKFITSLRRKVLDVQHTTPTHKFIRTLRDGGKLVRCYTQNIDGLESREGLNLDLNRGKGNKARFMKKVVEKARPDALILPGHEMDGGCEVVQLHGDLKVLRCSLCHRLCSWDDEDREEAFLRGKSPPCQFCASKDNDRRGRGKRGTAVGLLRPNVVLYGEEHPMASLLSPMTTSDLSLGPDLLLILGTSLRVHGLKVLVREFAKSVHARGRGKGKVIFVNATKPPESVWNDVIDWWIEMDCDTWVVDLKERRGDLWLRQGELKLETASGNKRPKTKYGGKDPTRAADRTKSISESDKENIPAQAISIARKPTMKEVIEKRIAEKAANILPKVPAMHKTLVRKSPQKGAPGGKQPKQETSNASAINTAAPFGPGGIAILNGIDLEPGLHSIVESKDAVRKAAPRKSRRSLNASVLVTGVVEKKNQSRQIKQKAEPEGQMKAREEESMKEIVEREKAKRAARKTVSEIRAELLCAVPAEQAGRTVLRARGADSTNKVLVTPTKSRLEEDRESLQFPTPPRSDSALSGRSTPSKRRYLCPERDHAPSVSPSKRRKGALEVWVDNDAEEPNKDTGGEETFHVSPPRRSARKSAC
ncbi:MAG: hypothetical protein M1819_004700 [Sarea resinae]|nr:MAG: hypothetical protein M1819_004700 [Sarea resinae]